MFSDPHLLATPLHVQIVWLILIGLPIACTAWTVTHEDIFREPREFCVRKSQKCATLVSRKFFYLFTCEYCFSHYITILFLAITRYHLLFDDWRGYLLGGFSLVWVANVYMSIFGRVRLDIKRERVELKAVEAEVDHKVEQIEKIKRSA